MKRCWIAVAVATVAVFGESRGALSITVQDAPPQVAVADSVYGCVLCHADKRRAFIEGIHSERGIRCHDCHGGDPAGLEAPAAHTGMYIGTPDKLATVELCGSCHSDPDRMRQYGLHVGQIAEFRTSRHGQLLLGERNTDAPTCTDCHDAHTILTPDNARSRVHPTNIPGTCAGCHQDENLMATYGLTTDQFELYRESAHGVGLFDGQNFAAPSCVGCHGSHAALPPQVTEIANVCGQCHVLVRRAFDDGPHGAAAQAGALPGCTACHSNHQTEGVPPDAIAETCTECHAADSREARLGERAEELIVSAENDLQAADEAIEELVVAGWQVSDLRFRYQTALTDYLQITELQHSLDEEQLEDLSRRVGSISRDIRTTAEVSAEQRWEHKLLLVPVWFLTLSAIVLGWFKLRGLKK
jgi:DNA-directed RNA polymerase subunit RPC12/RpoP